jgi:hypothetical protein
MLAIRQVTGDFDAALEGAKEIVRQYIRHCGQDNLFIKPLN